jgi:hypothetical protein
LAKTSCGGIGAVAIAGIIAIPTTAAVDLNANREKRLAISIHLISAMP